MPQDIVVIPNRYQVSVDTTVCITKVRIEGRETYRESERELESEETKK